MIIMKNYCGFLFHGFSPLYFHITTDIVSIFLPMIYHLTNFVK